MERPSNRNHLQPAAATTDAGTNTPEPTPEPTPAPTPEPAPEPASDEVTGLALSSGAAGELVLTWSQPSEAPTDYRIAWTPAGEDYLSYSAENTSRRGNSYPERKRHDA